MKARNCWFYIAIALLTLYICFFYMERTEIGDVDIVRVLGIDYEGGRYRVSALYNNNGEAEAEEGSIMLVDGRGGSVYEAFNEMVRKNKRDISIAHTTYYLLSQAAARQGIEASLDFIERDPTVKMNAMIYILEQPSVYSYMKKSVDDKVFIHDEIGAISQREETRLKRVDNTISQVSSALSSPVKNLLIPYLRAEEELLYVNGYGVFKADRLIELLDYETSLAVDFFRNRLRTCPIYLDNEVGVEVTDMTIGERANIVNGLLQMDFDIYFESDVKEVATNDVVYADHYVNTIEVKQQEYVLEMLDQVIEYCKKNRVDLLEIEKLVRTRYPKEWNVIMEDFGYYLENLSYQYDVNSQTAGSYLVTN